MIDDKAHARPNAVKPVWAAIFDWDGVIIDSYRHHLESWKRLAEDEGRTLPPDSYKRGFGMTAERIIREIFGWTSNPDAVSKLRQRKGVLYREILRERGVEPLPGVATWLNTLRAATVPCAIASSSTRANIRCALELLGYDSYFKVIVAAEDVSRGKPDPQVFLLAAGKLAMPPERCVVFEDAVVGIQAAHAAGMKVVGVAGTNPEASLYMADRTVRRLDELDVSELNAWFC